MTKLVDSRGNPIRSLGDGARRPVRAKYDAAQESVETSRWWANADNLSSRAANSPEVREKLRRRVRYEVANGPYPAGIATTLAYDLVGVGPRLQVMTGDRDYNSKVETLWWEWSDSIRLPEKLRTMRRARAVDGESFALLETNRGLPTPSKLDVRVIEADLVCDPFGVTPDPNSVDGIQLDRYGYPASYYVLRQHPGDDYQVAPGIRYTTVPARLVIHWFRPDRPMQYRGVPEFTPALDIFGRLRRYALAVLTAAEIAAEYTTVLETDMPPEMDGNGDPIPAGETFHTERGMMVSLPAGARLKQLEAEQPVDTYDVFEIRMLKQVCRALGIPYFVATGDYEDVNFSSGRLGAQGYYRDIEVERAHISATGLDLVFAAWHEDMVARRAIDDLGAAVAHRWLWPGFAYFDPKKEAEAKVLQLQAGLTTWTDECHARGVDPEEQAQTMAADIELLESYGLPNPYTKQAATAPPGTQSLNEPEAESDVLPARKAAASRPHHPSRNGRH